MKECCRHLLQMKRKTFFMVGIVTLIILIIYPAILQAQYYPFPYGGNTWSYSSYPSWGWNSFGYPPGNNIFNPFSTYSYPSYGNYFNNNSFGYPYGNNSYSYPSYGDYFDNNSFGYPYGNNSYSYPSYGNYFNNNSFGYPYTEGGEIFIPYPYAGPEWPNWGSIITPSGSLRIVGGPYS